MRGKGESTDRLVLEVVSARLRCRLVRQPGLLRRVPVDARAFPPFLDDRTHQFPAHLAHELRRQQVHALEVLDGRDMLAQHIGLLGEGDGDGARRRVAVPLVTTRAALVGALEAAALVVGVEVPEVPQLAVD
jgi:hypothetical protein